MIIFIDDKIVIMFYYHDMVLLHCVQLLALWFIGSSS